MGLITQQDNIHKRICTLHTYYLFLNLASFPALSHTYSFPGWLLQGQKSFTQGNSARKSLGMDEKQELSRASCLEPFDLSLMSPLGSRQVLHTMNLCQPHCASAAPGRESVSFPGRETSSGCQENKKKLLLAGCRTGIVQAQRIHVSVCRVRE